MNNLYNQLNSQMNNTNEKPKATVQSIIEEVKQSGLSAKELFYKKAQELGIDPNSILSNLR